MDPLMPFPDPNYIVAFPPQIYFVDKDSGEPLSAGVVYFYEDTNRTVLKPIYQQVQLPDNTYEFVKLANPVTLTSVGTFSDDNGTDILIYTYPFEGLPTDETTGALQLYYVEVYSSDGVLQLTREAYPPSAMGNENPVDTFESSGNQISNPQFVEVLFDATPGAPNTDYTFSVTGTDTETVIAPNWSIITSSSGSANVSVKQVAIADSSVPSNPPYVIDINSTLGISDSIKLRQRLSSSPRLFYNGFVSGYLIAASMDGTAEQITMNYVLSSGATQTFPVAQGNTTAIIGQLTPVTGQKEIRTMGATGTAPTGYVDIEIILPPGRHVQISSVQIVDVQNLESSTGFLQESEARQIDHLFHYYKPKLIYKPIPSYLVGWDFPLNPAQPLGATVAATATAGLKSRYIWDQTIAFQSVDNTLSFARNSSTNGFKVITATTPTTFAIVQYLEAEQAREILSQRNSVQLKGFLSDTVSGGTLVGTVGLYWTTDASLPSVITPTFQSLVSSVVAPSSPLLAPVTAVTNGTWNQVPRGNLGPSSAPFTLSATNTVFDFTGFDATAVTSPSIPQNTATYFAIVISFNTMPITQTVTLDYVSLVGGDVATRPAPQTPDEVLRECQRFYEMSYAIGTVPPVNGVPATNTLVNSRCFPIGSSGAETPPPGTHSYAAPFELTFNTVKRSVIPTVTIIHPTSAASDSALINIWGRTASGNITGGLNKTAAFSTYWAVNSNGSRSISYSPMPSMAIVSSANPIGGTFYISVASVNFHFTADARLGVV